MIWFYWNNEEQSISQVRFKVTWATSEWLIFLSCQMIRINITNSGELDFSTKGGSNGKRRDKDIRHVENKQQNVNNKGNSTLSVITLNISD